MIKKLGLALIALVACVGIPAIAQMWLPFPIVGGSSFCTSTINTVCQNTVAAGPALTGNETIPGDTNINAGSAQPQTVKFSMPILGVGTLDYSAPLTGATVTALFTTRQIIVEPAGTIAALTVVFPAATVLVNGQRLGLCGTQIVTTLTMTAGSGTTISAPATAMLVPVATGAASCMEWIYRTANTTWYRVQ